MTSKSKMMPTLDDLCRESARKNQIRRLLEKAPGLRLEGVKLIGSRGWCIPEPMWSAYSWSGYRKGFGRTYWFTDQDVLRDIL